MTARTRTRGGRRRRRAEHGTEGEYRRGCRCDRCKAAASAARRARKDRQTRERELHELELELEELRNVEPEPGTIADVPRDVFARYVEARTGRDEAERVLAAAELELKRAIATAERIRVGGRLVGTWARTVRRQFDSARFRKEEPALWSSYQRDTPIRRLVLTMFAATPPQRQARAAARGWRR